MRRALGSALCVVVAAGLLGGCLQSTRETAARSQEFVTQAGPEVRQTRDDIAYYIKANSLEVHNLKLDAEHFLEWRRREWWALQDETAWQIHHEWRQVEALTRDVARTYGYEVSNFPRTGREVAAFMHQASAEWRGLVQDCQTFIEYKDREKIPLRDDLRDFYRRIGWESANLAIDVNEFLRWRQREYRKLIKDGRDFFAAGGLEWEALQRDIARLRASNAVTGRYLLADLSAFARNEAAQVPRLIDDVANFTRWREDEWRALRRDIDDAARNTTAESVALIKDIERFHQHEMEQIPLLMRDVDDFFAVYEREVRPLSEEVKRFWRENIAAGHLLIVDLKEFYAASHEEAALLELDIRQFLGYGSVEWRHLCKTIAAMTKDDQPSMRRPWEPLDPPFMDHSPPRTGTGQ